MLREPTKNVQSDERWKLL